jgi:hypothetical protein
MNDESRTESINALFKPQPETELVPAFTLRRGDIVIYEDETQCTVKSAKYVSERGFYRFRDRTSVAWVVTFEGGREQACNRDAPVRIIKRA